MNTMSYKGFLGSIAFSEKDRCFHKCIHQKSSGESNSNDDVMIK